MATRAPSILTIRAKAAGLADRHALYNKHARDKDDKRQTHRWRKVAKYVLATRVWCEHCLKRGLYTPSVQVHHTFPVLTYPERAFDQSTLEALCIACHRIADAKLNKVGNVS